jgi:hypothetical protein
VKTWVLEAAVAGTALSTTAALTVSPENIAATWVTAAAVFLTFMHMQIADRLADAEELRTRLQQKADKAVSFAKTMGDNTSIAAAEAAKVTLDHYVECYWKLTWYLVAKEILWLVTFVLLKAWPALVGVGLFLLYPIWRHFYRTRIKPCA